MKRNTNKKGFTLIEMIATISIIVIMSSAVAISATSTMNRAKSVATVVDAKTANYDSAMSQVNSLTEVGVSVQTPTPLPTVGAITVAPTSAPTSVPTTAGRTRRLGGRQVVNGTSPPAIPPGHRR